MVGLEMDPADLPAGYLPTPEEISPQAPPAEPAPADAPPPVPTPAG
jgi:hypothetical protein